MNDPIQPTPLARITLRPVPGATPVVAPAQRPPARQPGARVHHVPASGDHRWSASASACDPFGCLVDDAPRPLGIGDEVVVELEDERVGPPVFVTGFVRSCAETSPLRLSIRLDTVGLLRSLRFF